MPKFLLLLCLLLTSGVTHASLGEFLFNTNRSLEAWRADVESRTLQVKDVEWHFYARHTDGLDAKKDRCTVLIHGFTAEGSHWLRFARQLKTSRCLIIPDMPGFGLSSYDPASSYSIPLQAARLRDFLDVTIPGVRIDLAGSSMGGHISSMFTLENPQRVATLTLFDAGGVEAANKSVAAQVLETSGKPIFHVVERDAFYRLMATNFNESPWMPAPVLDFLADRFISRNERHMHIFGDIHGKDRVDARLGELQLPVLVVWGSDDHILDKSMGDRYAALINGARHEVFEQVGHLPFLEKPAESAALFDGFVGGR